MLGIIGAIRVKGVKSRHIAKVGSNRQSLDKVGKSVKVSTNKSKCPIKMRSSG